MQRPSIKSRVEEFVLGSEGVVFLRAEFSSFGGRSQIGCALRELVQRGLFVKVGFGIYARARKSSLSDKIVPDADLMAIGFEALRKLGFKPEASLAMKSLAEGRSTQVPMAHVISVDRPVGRKIGFGRRSIIFETR